MNIWCKEKEEYRHQQRKESEQWKYSEFPNIRCSRLRWFSYFSVSFTSIDRKIETVYLLQRHSVRISFEKSSVIFPLKWMLIFISFLFFFRLSDNSSADNFKRIEMRKMVQFITSFDCNSISVLINGKFGLSSYFT